MMNWHNTLAQIYQKLEESGYADLSLELKTEQLKGGTGGEILSLVLAGLLSLRDLHPDAYSMVETEAEGMIEYGKEIGYL